MPTLIKTTLDGRRLEVVGTAICLDGRLEAIELVEVSRHPNRAAILSVAPEATHMAGRVPLSAGEARAASAALADGERSLMASPAAIEERFRLAFRMKACEQGIE